MGGPHRSNNIYSQISFKLVWSNSVWSNKFDAPWALSNKIDQADLIDQTRKTSVWSNKSKIWSTKKHLFDQTNLMEIWSSGTSLRVAQYATTEWAFIGFHGGVVTPLGRGAEILLVMFDVITKWGTGCIFSASCDCLKSVQNLTNLTQKCPFQPHQGPTHYQNTPWLNTPANYNL